MQLQPPEASPLPTSRPLPPTARTTTSSSGETLELGIVPTDQVEAYWPLVETLIQSALPRALGRLTLHDVHGGLMSARFGLWIVGSHKRGILACGVTEILEFSRKRILSVFLYAGERRRVMSLWPIVEDVARVLECDEVQIAGPRAWGRIFPDFHEAFTVYTKEVR